MQRPSTHAAGQARLAWRLFRISAVLNILLATGIAALGCYGVMFNPTRYLSVDSNLHFTDMYAEQGMNRHNLKLVDNIYTGKTDGNLLEEEQRRNEKAENAETR